MTGTFRRHSAELRCSGLVVRSTAFFVIAALAGAVFAPAALAQSGRRRPAPAPAPAQPKPVPLPTAPGADDPTPVEAPATPVPPGGLVADQSVAGALTRYVLRNGVTLLVRENPATPLAAVYVATTGPVGGERAPRPGGHVAARIRGLGGEVEVAGAAGQAAYMTVVPGPAVAATLDAYALLLEPPNAQHRPDGTTVVVTGNVFAYAVLSVVQRSFGAAAAPAAAGPAAPAAPAAPEAPVQAGLSYRTSRSDTGAAAVTVAYPAPALAEDDAAAADLLAIALAGGRTSRLGRALRWPALAADATPFYESTDAGARLGVSLAVDPKRLDAAEAVLFREVERLRRERVSDGELQRARNVYERRFHAERETVDGEALALARFERATGDVRAASRHLERVRAATAADLQRVAARYLVVSRAEVSETLPPDAPERTFTAKAFAETVAAWAPGAGRDVAPDEVRGAEAAPVVVEGRERRRANETEDVVVLPVPVPIRDFSTLNGPKAIVREDQSRPLLSIGLLYPAGRVAEAAAERGITELMLRSLLRGSRKYPADRLVWTIEQYGGEVRIVNEPDFFGVVVEVLSRNADQIMPLAIELVERPVFDKEEVARERDLLLVDQRRAAVAAPSRAVDLFWQSRFPGHAYGVPALGLPDTVARMTDEQVKAWSSRAARSQLPLVAVVGDTDGSSLIARHVADAFDRREGAVPPAPGLPAPAAAGEAAESRDVRATAQAIGYPCPGGTWLGHDPLEVATALVAMRAQGDLDGDGGAVRVDSLLERRRLAGAAILAVVSAPADEARARARVEARIGEVASIADADVAAARERAAVARQLREQPFTVLLLEYVRAAAFGAPLETVETSGERLRAVSGDAVRKVAAAVFTTGLTGRGVVRGR